MGSRAGGRHGDGEQSCRMTSSGFFGLRLLLRSLASGTGGVCEHPPQAWPGVGGQTQAHTGHRETMPKATIDGHLHAPPPWPLGRPTGKSEPPKAQARAPPGCAPGQNPKGSGRLSPPRLPATHIGVTCGGVCQCPRGVSGPQTVSPLMPPSPGPSWGCAEGPRGGNPAEVSSGRHARPPPASPLFS